MHSRVIIPVNRLATSIRHVSISIDSKHTDFLKAMYNAGPINGLFNQHDVMFDPHTGNTTLHFTPEFKHCHTAGSLHGSGYFKMLDDASFFAAQAQVTDNFIYTVSFNVYLIKAVMPGVPLIAKGWVTSAGKSLIIAEAKLLTRDDEKIVATGSGSFMKSPVPLNSLTLS